MNVCMYVYLFCPWINISIKQKILCKVNGRVPPFHVNLVHPCLMRFLMCFLIRLLHNVNIPIKYKVWSSSNN